jgi:hypothetical protein
MSEQDALTSIQRAEESLDDALGPLQLAKIALEQTVANYERAQMDPPTELGDLGRRVDEVQRMVAGLRDEISDL